MIRFAVAVVVAVAVFTAIASAAPPPRSASTGASAFLLRITIPGQDTVALGDLEWPTSTTADVQSFQYPARRLGRQRRQVARRGLRVARIGRGDAVVLRGDRRVASSTARSSRARSPRPSPRARASARSARRARPRRCRACARSEATSRALPERRVSLEDWGTLTVLAGSSGHAQEGPPAAQASVTALRRSI